jgi:hypothetical protein
VPDPILRPSDAVNLAGQETGREHLSHSRLNLFLACHEKYRLHYEERLEPIGGIDALSMGSAFQKAIELQDPEAGPLALDGYVPVENEAALHGWVYVPPAEPLHFHTQEAEDKHRVNQAIVRAAAALYLRRWPAPVGETREFEYRVRLRNPWSGHYSRTFDLLGYADGLIDRTALDDARRASLGNPNRYELVENKLSSNVRAAAVQHLPLDRQLALARYGVWRATGRAVARVYYRWTKKPSIKQRQGETVDEYIDRIAEDYEARPDFYAIEEQPKFVGTDDLLRIEMELWQWASQLREMRRSGFYARNTASCLTFGKCKYVELCSGDPDAHALYEQRAER